MDKDDREHTRLLEAHNAHVRAWNEYDLGALGEVYDHECFICDTILPPAFRDLEAFLAQVTPLLQTFTGFKLRTFDHMVRVDERKDDRIGWIASRYEIEARRGEGVHRRSGRWTEIYEKRDDGWKLVHLHSSDDPSEGIRIGSTAGPSRTVR